MLKLIDDQIERLKMMAEKAEESEHYKLQAKMLSHRLPSKIGRDQILRYATTIERQLYWDIDQLERLQRFRMGDAGPPSLNVQLS